MHERAIILHTKQKMISLIKVEFTAELSYWITLDGTGVPNEVAGECVSIL